MLGVINLVELEELELEYEANHPLNHMVTYYDKLHLCTVNMVVEDGKVVDKD